MPRTAQMIQHGPVTHHCMPAGTHCVIISHIPDRSSERSQAHLLLMISGAAPLNRKASGNATSAAYGASVSAFQQNRWQHTAHSPERRIDSGMSVAA